MNALSMIAERQRVARLADLWAEKARHCPDPKRRAEYEGYAAQNAELRDLYTRRIVAALGVHAQREAA